MESKFAEIRTDFADENGVIHLDGYKTDDDNEEGTGIGYFINGEVYWRDHEFQFDPYVKEVVEELKADYKRLRNIISNIVRDNADQLEKWSIHLILLMQQDRQARRKLHQGQKRGQLSLFEN